MISCTHLLSFSPGGETCSGRVRACPRLTEELSGEVRVWVQTVRRQPPGSLALYHPCVVQWVAWFSLGLKGRAWERSKSTKWGNSKETECHLLVMSWIKKIKQSWCLHLRIATSNQPLWSMCLTLMLPLKLRTGQPLLPVICRIKSMLALWGCIGFLKNSWRSLVANLGDNGRWWSLLLSLLLKWNLSHGNESDFLVRFWRAVSPKQWF